MCDSPWTGCAWRTTPYIYVARTSNNRVIMACESYCCLLAQCEALRTCRSGLTISTVETFWIPDFHVFSLFYLLGSDVRFCQTRLLLELFKFFWGCFQSLSLYQTNRSEMNPGIWVINIRKVQKVAKIHKEFSKQLALQMLENFLRVTVNMLSIQQIKVKYRL